MDFLDQAFQREEIDETQSAWEAASEGNLERIIFLLQHDKEASVNMQDTTGYSMIHAAVSYNQLGILKYLLEHAGDINIRDIDGDTPLLLCEEVCVLEFLMQNGSDIHARNKRKQGLIQKVRIEGSFSVPYC